MVYYNNIHKLKVGIFDSGIGGLPVYYALKQKLEMQGIADQVSIKYLGDTKNFPYGTKTREELSGIVSNNIKLLLSEGCSIIGIEDSDKEIIMREVKRIVNKLPENVDTFVLGCTHFYHINEIISNTLNLYNKQVSIVDPTSEMVETLYQNITKQLDFVSQPARSDVVFSGNTPSQTDID